MRIWYDIRSRYERADPVTRLIALNSVFFGAGLLINLFGFLFLRQKMLAAPALVLPSGFSALLHSPWTILTYQFSHFGILHFGFNMLVLYFAGAIFRDFFRQKDVWRVYIFGGVVAGGLFILSCNFIPAFRGQQHTLVGASGSIMAILFAATLYAPNVVLHLFGVVPVRLKWIALAYIVLDLLSIPESNAGGHIAHLGGAIFGSLYALYRMKRVQIKLFEPVIRPQNKKVRMKAGAGGSVHQTHTDKSNGRNNAGPTQEEIDAILDKISKSGYDRLTKEEKDILFKASQD